MTAARPRPPEADLACMQVVQVITEYLERALPADEAEQIACHLATCPGCSEYLDQIRTVAAWLHGLGEHSLPAARRHELVAAFRAVRRHRAGFPGP